MNLGLFLMPLTAPETSIYHSAQITLEMIRYADQLGYAEAWVGEHYTTRWEKIPSPDIIIAQALLQTKQIKLAAGAHLLPYHHPVELAQRVAFMDHLAQGRLMLGIAPGALSTDAELFGIESRAETNERTAEALKMMFKLWTEDEIDYKGKYWTAKTPSPLKDHGIHIKPFQQPHIPIGVAGSGTDSPTLRLAGEYGFMPMSLGVTEKAIQAHWNCVAEGAAKSGRTPNKKDWRIVQQIMVADTDEEAFDLAINGMLGRAFRDYLLPFFGERNLLDRFKLSPEMKDEEVTVEFLAKEFWLIGSPSTVAKKLESLYEAAGGFGTLLVNTYDYGEKNDAWYHSMRLLKEEVLPRMKYQVV